MARQTISVEIAGTNVSLKKHHLAKYIKLRVKNGGDVEVVAPIRTSFNTMAKFAKSHEEWILHTINRLKQIKMPKDNEIYLLGARYSVAFGAFSGLRYRAILLCQAKVKSFIFNGKFAVDILANENSSRLKGVIIARDKIALKKLKQSLCRTIFGLCFARLKPFISGKVNAIRIKQMSTRWGSCNSRKGYINLSLELISRSFSQIEYVVAHELTHLNYPHHKPSFYSALSLIIPDYKDKERLLKIKNL